MQIKIQYLDGELSATILDEGIEVSCYINEVNDISDSHKEIILDVEADLASHTFTEEAE
jgi:hypothetical protein